MFLRLDKFATNFFTSTHLRKSNEACYEKSELKKEQTQGTKPNYYEEYNYYDTLSKKRNHINFGSLFNITTYDNTEFKDKAGDIIKCVDRINRSDIVTFDKLYNYPCVAYESYEKNDEIWFGVIPIRTMAVTNIKDTGDVVVEFNRDNHHYLPQRLVHVKKSNINFVMDHYDNFYGIYDRRINNIIDPP